MAGIIAGKDPGSPLDPTRFVGVAPDARLTSLKVASYDGAVDVSQVIAAVDWVVEHRNDDPAHPIRVLNLSYGTDGVQDYEVDPLTHAVENAWRAGIVVVVSGGNSGFGSGKLNNPAYDPHVIAVGAADTRDTAWPSDDTVPDFSSRGDASRRVDVTAPGRSIVSLRDPGSYVDTVHPGARYEDRFFKGSGTSQAAAVVSGAVALLLEQRPDLTPDQVKALLRSTAASMPMADAAGRGAGRDQPRRSRDGAFAHRQPELGAVRRDRLARGGPRHLARRRRRRRADRREGHPGPVERSQVGRRQQRRDVVGRRPLEQP